MECIGEYYILDTIYMNIMSNILKNKTNTSWLYFPNGIKNKVYLEGTVDNPIDMYILYPLDRNKKLIIKKNILNGDAQKLVMYNSGTRYNISKKDIVASD
jgi:hypothetical protein